MADPLAMVKVGNSACGFLKLTPLSRTSAIAGASSGVTFNAPNPSGMNRIRLWGVEFCANAMPADSIVRLADSNTSERRINISPEKRFSAYQPLPLFSFAVRRNCYTRPRVPDCRPLTPPQRLQVSQHVQTNSNRESRRNRLPDHQDCAPDE